MNNNDSFVDIIKLFEEFIFNSILIQFLFNNITTINIIVKLITYNYTNLFTMFLGYFYNIINICYNKYRFDKLENIVYQEFREKFKNIDEKFKNIDEKIDDIDEKIDDIDEKIDDMNNKLNLILEKLNKN